MQKIPKGQKGTLIKMPEDLAKKYKASKTCPETCPATSGIFLRIVVEAAYEEFLAGKDINEVTTFWRIVDPKSKLATKLECGPKFIETQGQVEEIE